MCSEEYYKKLSSGLLHAYKAGLHTDTVVHVGEKCYKCHKVILGAVSPFFETMYTSGMRESESGEVDLKGLGSSTFEIVLKYIYTGKDILTEDNVGDVLQAASMLQIESLLSLCESFLAEHLNTENCLYTWKLGHTFNCENLARESWNIVLFNFKKLWQTDDFLQIGVHDLRALIKDNDLNTNSEELVCEAVFQWLGYDDDRKKYLSELFEHLRLPLVRPEYLIEVVERNYSDDVNCKEIIEEAKRYHLLPARRHEFVSPRLVYRNHGEHDEVICCVGGGESLGQTSQTVMCYSPRQQAWFPLSSLPFDPGNEFATCSYGNAIFVSGGTGCLSSLLYYQSTHNIWYDCEKMLCGRRRHGMVAIGESLYVFGGYDDNVQSIGKTLKSVQEYHIIQQRWHDIGELCFSVRSFSAAVTREKILIFGGIQENGSDTPSIQCFDTRHHTCSIITDLPFPSRLSVAVVYNRKVLIICTEGQIIQYEDGPIVSTLMQIPEFERCTYGAVQHDGKLLILGGVDTNMTYDEIVCVDVGNESTTKSLMKLPMSMYGFGCCKIVIHKKFLQNFIS